MWFHEFSTLISPIQDTPPLVDMECEVANYPGNISSQSCGFYQLHLKNEIQNKSNCLSNIGRDGA